MTKARDLANIISGGFTADDIPNLDTAKITTGTFVDARMPSTVLNNNVDLTNLSATNLTSGTVPIARLGSSGTKDSTTFLRGDNTFAEPGGGSRTLLTSGESLGVTTLTFTNSILDSSYNVFEIFLCQASRTTSGALEMFVSTNNGSNYHNVDRIYHFTQVYAGGGGGTSYSSQAVNTDRLQFNVSNAANDFTNTYIQIIRPKFAGGSAGNRNRNTIMAESHTCQNVGSSVNLELVTTISCISHSDTTNRNNNIDNIKLEGNGATMDYKYAIYGIAW